MPSIHNSPLLLLTICVAGLRFSTINGSRFYEEGWLYMCAGRVTLGDIQRFAGKEEYQLVFDTCGVTVKRVVVFD